MTLLVSSQNRVMVSGSVLTLEDAISNRPLPYIHDAGGRNPGRCATNMMEGEETLSVGGSGEIIQSW